MGTAGALVVSVVTSALFSVINGDATTTANLSTFNGAPAVFSGRQVPDGAEPPFVRISQEITNTPDDTLLGFGRDIIHDIIVVFPLSGSETTLESTTERIRDLLHFTDLAVSGFNHVQTIVSGPVGLTAEGDEVGLVLEARVQVKKA